MAAPVIQMRTPAEAAFIARFEAEAANLPGAKAERAAAFARFEKAGLPGRRVEAYHYTDLRNLMRTATPVAKTEQAPATMLAFEGITHRLVLANGRYLGGSAPEGVTVRPLVDALADGLVPGAAMGQASDIVVDLNTAFTRDGLRLAVAGAVEAPLHLAFVNTVSGPSSIMPRIIVDVAAGASFTLVESHEGPDGIAYQVNAVVELRLGAGATVEHIRLNREGDKALALTSLAATLQAEAELTSLGVTLGADTSRHQAFITYQGENAKLNLSGAAMLKGSQHHDSTLVVDHAVAQGTSRELFRTVVDGSAQGVFQGKIIVRQDAQKTDGQMASNALLLSDDAGMSNKPELEIFADDVVCAHGATCGALDDSQLFYLMARGLPREAAEALLVEAFIDEVLDAVSHEGLREALAGMVSDWMKARVA